MKEPVRKSTKTARRAAPSSASKKRPATAAGKRKATEPTADLRRTISQRDRKIEKLEGQVVKLEAQIETRDARFKTLRTEAKALKIELAEYKTACDDWNEDYGELKEKFKSEKGLWKDKLDAAFQTKLKGEAAITELTRTKGAARATLDAETSEQIRKLKASTQKYHDQCQEFERQVKSLTEQLEAARVPT
jgi:chromosome segregation ATPase